ncbi:YceI family protein [Leptospira sp. GIMC2001]|uniref:YceI family protein n=1 Tax=Leptospira sp. GIMC2001 TaxID=1513297 RepID=UPI0023497DF9|nr:YceI family protein [Leptospira sp. GIMC2001]WCL48978.1 YceI family protein [Leptospira sp. GIMC2001]
MRQLYSFLILGFSAFMIQGDLHAQEKVFTEQEHCIAWRASKKMFLLSNSAPVGKNCSITTSATKLAGGIVLKGTFPVNKFDSDEPTRDEEVTELLGGKENPTMFLESEPLSTQRIKKIMNDSDSVAGKLTINGKQHPVIFTVKGFTQDGNIFYQGNLKTKLSTFGITPPTVAGGVIADVRDEIELLFQFQKTKINGHP